MPKNDTIIHKTYSKKDLLVMIDDLNIPIGVDDKLGKSVVANSLWDILCKMQFMEFPDDNKYLVKTIGELKKYLMNPNPRKPYSVKDRDKYIIIAKKINHYCENGYDVKYSLYMDIKDIYKDADYIKLFGDISIVRKSIYKLMKDPKRLYHIKPIISPHVQHDLNIKKSLTHRNFYKCSVKKGKFLIDFD